MTEFKSWQAYRTFQWHVRHRTRYILDDEVREFLDPVVSTSENRKRSVPAGRFFWRAQHGHGWVTVHQDSEEFEVPGPFEPTRMKPLRYAASEGRANAKGIPALYLATDKETAMAEVRPWVSSYISVGQFKTLRDLILIDCSVEHASGFFLYFKEPDPNERERAVWRDIDRSFSEPITASDASVEYVPTQVLSELFRNHGFDGISYKSNLGAGFNIVLFDIDAAEPINCFLFQAESVKFEFKDAANPYFVRKHYEQLKQENESNA